jgi:hypothetical protein
MTMTREREGAVPAVVRAALLGAAAMYWLDPDKGRRRRAIAVDKAARWSREVSHFAAVAARDLAHRLEGMRAQTMRPFRGADAPDDLRLIERVRAQIGRIVSHPHAIQVGASGGRIVLSGPVLAHEHPPLIAVVRSVPGVVSVESHLAVHATAGSISSLQGTGRIRRTRRSRWPPAMRALAIVGGAYAVAHGLQHRGLGGMLRTAIGIGLVLRGAREFPPGPQHAPAAPRALERSAQ